MSSFSLYHHPLCPFCKPIVYFANENKLSHEEVFIDLSKQETRTPEYLKLNPFGRVPAVRENDDGFVLVESCTIMRYLCNSRDVPDHWYPKDPKKRSQVDMFFDWFQVNIKPMGKYFYSKTELPNSIVTPGYDAIPELEATLKDIETIFLGNRKFLAADEISIADLMIIFLFVFLEVPGYDLSKFPKVKEWKERVLATNLKGEYQIYYDAQIKRIETFKASKTN
jgi:glutathione S-transferase